MSKHFLILGANKSGTSVACAIANTHPGVFCVYDADFTKAPDYPPGSDLVAFLPDSRALFEAPPTGLEDVLERVGELLAVRGYNFDFVGVKIAGLRPDLFSANLPTLYMVRNVRLWGAKNRVISDLIGKKQTANATAILSNYVATFVMSFLHPHVRRARLEDLFVDHDSLPRMIAGLLGLDATPFSQWWLNSDWKKAPPKNYSPWVEGHASAFLPPVFSDTRAETAEHPFWDAVLPIFDKYFLHINDTFPESEIMADLEAIKDSRKYRMTVNEAYRSFFSTKVGPLVEVNGKVGVDAGETIEKRPGESWRKIV